MLLYIFILTIIAITYIFIKTNKKTISNSIFWQNISCIAFCMIFILLSSFRNLSVGYDTISYYGYYLDKLNCPQLDNFEPLFELIYNFVIFFKQPFSCFLFICSLITILSFLNFYKTYSVSPLLSLFLFVSLGFWGNTFNAVRQYLALSVFLFSIKYIINGNIFKYFICFIIAFNFHYSAIIMIPLYFIRLFKLSWKSILVCTILSFLCVFSIEPLTSLLVRITGKDYAGMYISNPNFYSNISPYYISYAIGLICVFFFLNKSKKKYRTLYPKTADIYELFLSLFFFQTIIRFSASFSPYFSLINRFSIFFFFSITILIPMYLKTLSKKQLSYLFPIFLIGCFLYNIISGTVRKTNGVYPFKFTNIFDKSNLPIFITSIFITIVIATFLILREKKPNKTKNVIIARSTSIFNDSRTIKLINELLEMNYNVYILGWDRENTYNKIEYYHNNNKTAKIFFFKKQCPYGGGVKNIFKMILFQIWLRIKLLKLPNNSIIHACDYDTASPLFKSKGKRKFIYDIYDYYCESRNMPKFLKFYFKINENYIIDHADSVIICSEYRINQIKNTHPKDLVVIHNTPDLPNLKLKNKPHKKLRIAYIGVLDNSRLVDKILLESHKYSNIEFYIGGSGKFADTVKTLSSKQNNIIFYGPLPYSDVLKIENSCDLLFATYDPAIPNHKYSAPNKFYEAGALSKPIIVCNNTGIDSLVKKYNSGICINYDVNEFYECITSLDYELINRLGKNGKDAYEKYFSWNIMKNRLINLYKEI